MRRTKFNLSFLNGQIEFSNRKITQEGDKFSICLVVASRRDNPDTRS